jgi:type I restriction enzyme S subunit
MRSEWKKVQLGDVASVRGGKRLPKGKRLVTSNSAHPYIRVRDMSGTKVLEINEKFEFVPTDAVEEINRYKVNTNDIIISIVGSVGEVSMVGASLDGANLTENCAKISKLNDEKINAEYLYYYLTSSLGQNNISKGTVGAVQLKLPLKNIRSLEILLPVLPTQKAIASVLSCLDAKIELNNEINENLEAQAQVVFKNWFVDFEPFQDGEFVESELGLIPEGWHVSALSDAIDVNPVRILKKGSLATHLGMANVPTSGSRALSWKQREFTSGTRFTNGDVLVARITPCLENGKTAFVDFLSDGEIGWGSTEFIVMRSREPWPVEYAYCLARYEPFRAHLIGSMTGTSGRQRVANHAL